jgi:hypothetical protein
MDRFMTKREVTHLARRLLASGMREARDETTDNAIVREEMSKEMDRVLARWWPRDFS